MSPTIGTRSVALPAFSESRKVCLGLRKVLGVELMDGGVRLEGNAASGELDQVVRIVAVGGANIE